ncbi:tripartite tricarboxylate transporter TctB family protein [Mycoplana rhizolycopersici]|uniref:Tripartite tricarboxylate transporter TctB family protein n=1 Tax=Mycoplana rhizolycopersici TaxID=2746702 RepID=A0ABX2QNV8_9HYPH|nr:tripartite tricarboxylate transporter TctB family protein [Rhizobium rhizolycopersici]NVP58233.1 tripartite tricarboxylate transporter TctB family protein [Rhizobium rhizolycopersici]
MTNQASAVPGSNLSPVPGGEATRKHFWQNLVAACIAIAWNAGFLFMSLGLPAGHSRGDVGPGSLPMQVSVFGLVVSAVYLVQVLRGTDFGGSSEKIDVARVAGLLGLFVAVALSANWIGLALCLGIGTGVATLLFPGEKPFVRAVATGAGFWLIAWGLFGKLLELPLP